MRRQRVSRCTQARTRAARVVIAGRSLAHSHRRHTHSPEFVLGVDGKVIIFLASVHIDILTYTTLGIIQFMVRQDAKRWYQYKCQPGMRVRVNNDRA